jgi:hypothetical protein
MEQSSLTDGPNVGMDKRVSQHDLWFEFEQLSFSQTIAYKPLKDSWCLTKLFRGKETSEPGTYL